MSIPSTQLAAITGTDSLIIKEVPVQKPGADEVLIKVEAAAVNPTDWKHLLYGLTGPGAVSGCDLAGEIVEVGSAVTNLAVGDFGVGLIHGSNKVEPKNGAFTYYAVGKAHLFYKINKLVKSDSSEIPRGVPTTFEGASSLGVSLVTIAISLFLTFGGSFGLTKTKPEEAEKVILIWGGASSTGQIAIQFAKNIGWKIVTTASKKNEAELKALGADAVFDYNDADVVEKIKAFGGENIVYALDTISLETTIVSVHAATSTTKPVIIDNLLGITGDKIPGLRSNVTVTQTVGYLATGVPFKFGDNEIVVPGIAEFVKAQQPAIVDALNKGLIQHIPIKVLPGGLNAVNEAFTLSKENKVSNQKLVFRPFETK